MGVVVNVGGGTLVVEGPATVRVVSGSCDVLGCPLSGEFSIEEFRAVPIRGNCSLSIEGGVFRYFSEDTIPREWDSVDNLEGIALVIGGVDSGKTTLVTYLLNKYVTRGLGVCVVDADVGQSSIGPPGVVGLSCIGLPTPSLDLLHMTAGYFVGCTSPSQCIGRFLSGVSVMVREALASRPALVLVDMPGWVDAGGVELIRDVIDAVAADYVISIELNRRFQVQTIKLPRPRYVRARGPSERRELRVRLLRRYLSNLRSFDVGLDRVLGNYIIECLAENCGEYVIDGGVDRVVRGGTVRVPPELLRNVFVGLYRRGFLVGFGIIREFDFRGGVAHALVTTEDFERAVAGRMRVDADSLEELEPLPLS
ncbi:Clp1/GlmU family protein [Vulcanisaeta thermophila]|uniref:Clp1/GlmU family protein n=1 Tax=Vulcanisaeta thermophila TaxID=867917 RepID=UPI0008533684|nr:Clp1/GlmU family protein [Vulcanisaeta thermophila]